MADIDRWLVSQIVSGGQTGVDRAALDWARQRGVVHGGWCPNPSPACGEEVKR